MKLPATLCLVGVAGLIGCAEPAAPVASSDTAAATAEATVDGTLVSLKVPNMH